MSERQPDKTALYKNQRVRAYIMGERVYIDIDDLDAITGYRKFHTVSGGFLNPELDKAILDVRTASPEFADWLNEEFGELTLTDYSDIDFTRRD